MAPTLVRPSCCAYWAIGPATIGAAGRHVRNVYRLCWVRMASEPALTRNSGTCSSSADARRRQADVAGDDPADGDHAFLGETFDPARPCLGVRLVVDDRQLDRTAGDPAGRVELVDGELHAVADLHTPRRERSGERRQHADDDRLTGRRRRDADVAAPDVSVAMDVAAASASVVAAASASVVAGPAVATVPVSAPVPSAASSSSSSPHAAAVSTRRTATPNLQERRAFMIPLGSPPDPAAATVLRRRLAGVRAVSSG